MKRIYSFMVATVALVAAVSCNKEFEQENIATPSEDAITFIANVDKGDAEADPAAKSVMGDGISLWDGTENIWILDPQNSVGDDGNEYFNTGWKKGFTATANKAESVTFTEDDETVDFNGTSFMALYPASPANSATWEGGDADVAGMWLKNEQNAVLGSYDPEAHIAVAKTQQPNNVLSFKNVIALIKFQVNCPAVNNVKFISYGAEGVEAPKIAGNFSVSYNDGEPVATIETGDNKFSTNEVSLKGEFSTGKDYYMSILPANFTEGFGVEINGYKVKELSGEQAKDDFAAKVDRKRGSVLNLKTLTLGFGICGSLNEWESDVQMAYNETYGMYVAEDVVFDKGTNELKIRVNGEWLTSVGTGGEISINAENDAYIGGGNSVIADGTYDIWFDADDKIIYALTDGKTPGNIYTSTVYLKPNSNWTQGGARFAAYFYRNGEAWVDMTDTDGDGIYECQVPAGVSRVIFGRMNPNVSYNRWNNETDTEETKSLWNQSSDLGLPVDDKNCYTVAEGAWDMGEGSWSTLEDAKNSSGDQLPSIKNWGIVGSLTGWGSAVDISMTLNGDWYVAQAVEMVAGTTFKFRADGKWASEGGAELTYNGTIEAGNEYEVSSGSGNITVGVGAIYDVYLSRDETKMKIVYVDEIPEVDITVYFRPSNALSEAVSFAAWCWAGDGNGSWYSMTDTDNDGVYELTIPSSLNKIIFAAMNASEPDWNNKTYQTGNLDVPSDEKDCFLAATDTWMTLDEAKAYEEVVPEPSQVRIYINNTWGWPRLYCWMGEVNVFGDFPGATYHGTEVVDGTTYFYWNIPEEYIGQTVNIISSNPSEGKQTKDMNNVDLSESRFFDLDWNSVDGEHLVQK